MALQSCEFRVNNPIWIALALVMSERQQQQQQQQQQALVQWEVQEVMLVPLVLQLLQLLQHRVQTEYDVEMPAEV